MAFTLNDLETLERAIATSAKKVKYADKEVEYTTTKEMHELRALMRDELGLNGTNPTKSRRKFASFSKGLN